MEGLNEVEIHIHPEAPQSIAVQQEGEVDVTVTPEKNVIRGVDGVSPIAKVVQNSNGATITITDVDGTTTAKVENGKDGKNGSRGEQGIPGTPGADGFSPIATVTKSGDTATISITDADGTTTAQVSDGTNGTPGADGFSPIATVTKSGDTATISITDKNGTTSAQVSDGTDGTPGAPGADGFSPIATVTKSGNTATISITDKNGTTTATVTEPTVDSALSWTSQNPVENQAIRKAIYVKNSSDDKEAGINIPFSNPNLNPYVHIGSKTSASKGNKSVGIGFNAESSAVRSVAIGDSATASKREGVALGPSASAGQYSLSIGYSTSTVPNYSTAVGPYAKVLTGATNATAIGYQSEASEAETVSVGKSTNKRRIVNVADGTTASDVATVGQLPTRTEIFTSSTGENGDFQTTSAMSNYDAVEFTYRDGNNNYMTRTVPGNASSFVLDIVHPGANSTAYWYMSRWTVSGTSLTASSTCGRKVFTSTISSATSKDVYITKVVGVKY